MPSALLTRLRDLKIEEVSGVDRPASMLDGFMVFKAREKPSDVLRKAANWTLNDALAVVVDRLAERAVAKARLAEMFGTEVPVTEDERIACRLVLKARHSARHLDGSGRFAPAKQKLTLTTPEPADVIDAGAQAATTRPITMPSIWKHGGASLLR